MAGVLYRPMQQRSSYDESGIASWYGKDFHGKYTANGERYDMYALSGAHKTLPLPTLVRVTNLENGRSIIVRINDRGPFVKERLIDLSYAAAKALDFTHQGTARVRVQTLDRPTPRISTATTAQNNLYIQIGAFRSKESAEQLYKKLIKNHANTMIHKVILAHQQLYRVRIGPFQQQQIERAMLSLQSQGYQNSIVITDKSPLLKK